MQDLTEYVDKFTVIWEKDVSQDGPDIFGLSS